MNFLAMINARKGSKGIPNKNKKIFNNKPLISWTFDLVYDLKDFFADIVLSTDDPEIIEISKKKKIIIPIKRPLSLAGDKVLQIDVITHALKKYESMFKKKIDAIVLFQPTCPLREHNKVIECINKFKKLKPDNLITVSKLKRNLLHSIYNISGNYLKPIINIDKKGSLRQRNPIYYHRVGYLYIIKSELIKKRILFGSKVIGVEVDSFYSFDIDENFDFKLQELLIKNKNLFYEKRNTSNN